MYLGVRCLSSTHLMRAWAPCVSLRMHPFARAMTALLRLAGEDSPFVHNTANAWRIARSEAEERGEWLLLATLSLAQRERSAQ